VSRRIARPRVVGRVVAGLDAGALLLVADAGFGKTWAIEDGLQARGFDAAWMRVNEDDHDPLRFLHSLVHALHGLLGDAADTLGDGIAGEPLPALRSMIRDLERILVEPVAIVIDDGERLDGADALPLVDELLRSAGGRVRVVVASRRPLGLRVAKLRLSGRLHELDRGQLTFDAEECATLLRARTGAPPEAALVSQVMEETGGWPLGIALWSHSGALHQGSRDELFAYFAEEALDGLDPSLSEALVDASLADEVDSTVAQALGLPPNLSEELARRGLFVLSVDADGSFRLHPLFRDFLRRRFEARDPAEAASRRRALGRALAASGRPLEGAEQLVAASAWDEAFDTLAHHGADLLVVGREAVVHWLDIAPADVREHPQAQLLEGQVELNAGQAAAAAARLRAAVDGFRERGDVSGEWSARYALVTALEMLGAVEELPALAEGFESVPFPQAPGVAMEVAIELAVRGRPESGPLAERALRHPEGGSLWALEHLRRCVFLYPSGDVTGAIAEIRAAWEALAVHDPLDLRAGVAYTRAAAYTEAGFYEDALDCIAEGLAAASGGMAARLEIAAADVLLRLGRPADAEAALARAGDDPPLGGNGVLWLEAARAEAALSRGDRDAARSRAERGADALADGTFADVVPAAARLVPVLVATGAEHRAREVIAYAAEVSAQMLPGDRGTLWQARLDAVRAALEFACGGDFEPSLERLFAAQAALPHVVRVEWKLLRAPLRLALERGRLDPERAVTAIAQAWPDGAEVLALTDHPRAEVRAAAIRRAVASGRPEAVHRAQTLREDPSEVVAAVAVDAARRAAAAPPPRWFRTLGGFAFGRGDWTAADADWRRPMAARIVRYLLVQRPHAVPEEALFDAFWPDKDPAAARRNLQVNVSHARALLDLPGAAASAIESAGGGYLLRLGPADRVDADVFDEVAARALAATGAERRALLEQAARAWHGEPLADERYADWAAPWRQNRIDRYMHVLDALIDARYAAGDEHAAIAAARELLAQDQLNERAHRRLMEAYARAGRTGRALRQYLECRRLLVEELGIEPSRETRELHAQILAG
jgi:ATP/maltotriose-dependent transcriptional regulator MalT/DNA-binding SARP family transcriptional activator